MQSEATDDKLLQDDTNTQFYSVLFCTWPILPAFSNLRFSFAEMLSVDYLGIHEPKK